jgi:starch synthase
MLLMRRSGKNGKPGLDSILEGIGSRGCLIVLGTGDRAYEQFLTAASARHENFIFLNGFSEKCARALYAAGDLFLMPSSFEPCGLGQMLAMRAGQPCVVHAVGGLKDTVRDGHNGFSFNGATLEEQVDRFVGTTLEAIALRRENPAAWQKILQNAAAVRFTWEETAERYLNQLYSGQP